MEIYATYNEASEAAIILGIKTCAEYKVRHKEDPRLPLNPFHCYAKQWNGYEKYLGISRRLYLTYNEASNATRKLGIKTSAEYHRRYREDPRLYSNPSKYYPKEWKGFAEFVGITDRFYPTYEEASNAARKLGIKTSTEYHQRYREDVRLHSHPNKRYSKQWTGSSDFLGTAEELFPMSKSASKAAIKVDDAQPSNSGNLSDFLNTSDSYYPTYKAASEKAIKMGIKTRAEYRIRYKEDPRLYSNPQKNYAQKWTGFPDFLGTSNRFYPTYEEASKVTITLGIKTNSEYKIRYKEDLRLCSAPNEYYPKEWKGYPNFLGRPRGYDPTTYYPTYEEASKTTINLGIKTSKEYQRRYKEDVRLPRLPSEFYSNQWKGWTHYLGNTNKNGYRTRQI